MQTLFNYQDQKLEHKPHLLTVNVTDNFILFFGETTSSMFHNLFMHFFFFSFCLIASLASINQY